MDYSVFLDALKYVGTSPLTYVAFLVVALVWGVRSYFEHIQKLMQSLDKMPDADKKGNHDNYSHQRDRNRKQFVSLSNDLESSF